MKLVLKVCANNWINSSRDLRELSVYKEIGYDIAVLAKCDTMSKFHYEIIDGIKVFRCSTKPFGSKVPKFINKLVSFFNYIKCIIQINPNVISAHDLFPALLVSWLSTLFIKHKVVLIYDSHEFELERNVKRNVLVKYLIKILEGFLITKCKLIIVVNESIANMMFSIYKLKEKPLVVRNIPFYWHIDYDKCLKKRIEFINSFKNDSINKILMYHGNICIGRGIIIAIEIISKLNNVGLVILGKFIDQKFKNELFDHINSLGVSDRVIFCDEVKNEDLVTFIGAVDIELVLIEPIVKSYYYSLPNKLFESIQAGVPVIVSNLPELVNIVSNYNIGMICDISSIDNIIDNINQMLYNIDLYNSFKINTNIAKNKLCWEQEKLVLINKFIEIMK